MTNYVAQREAEIKAKYQAEMFWIKLCNLWEKLAKVMSLKRDADYYMGEYNKIRAEYIRKGRPVGYSPKKVVA